MKTTVTSYDFVRAFDDCGRSNQFSRAARFALFDYLEECETDCDCELELDPIAICCDWSECESAIEWCADYGMSEADKEALIEACDDPEDEDEVEAAILEHLRDNTQIVEFDGGILVAAF